jgi:hypothetical protein
MLRGRAIQPHNLMCRANKFAATKAQSVKTPYEADTNGVKTRRAYQHRHSDEGGICF